jgi:antitoxin component of MazEF toxin-antitoxin module
LKNRVSLQKDDDVSIYNLTIVGNSLALRIPASVIKDIRIADGRFVDLTVDGDLIIIKPSEKE